VKFHCYLNTKDKKVVTGEIINGRRLHYIPLVAEDPEILKIRGYKRLN
jgi:hypothetical protein